MKRYIEVYDNNGKLIKLQTHLTSSEMLNAPELNKGSAFSYEERLTFKLLGKQPAHIETIEEQAARCYRQYCEQPTNLAKNCYLNALKQNNLTLFYRLAQEHLEEMLPIVYTPTIGEAVEQFSHEFNKPHGLIISYPDIDRVEEILDNRVHQDIDLIIVTDGEGILGIGDWGVGGLDICVGKLMVYTLCAGINPLRTLPIVFDVGTNNEELLDDPMYLGWRHKRVMGKDYDDFIGKAVNAINKKFPGIYLHWEDFGRDNARKNLNRYRDEMCTFNDDIQGTGATALACIMAGLLASEGKLIDQRVVFFGAGTAGVGIADQICNAMQTLGLSAEEAHSRFWLIDRPGLLTDAMSETLDFQKPYLRAQSELADWTLEKADYVGLMDVVSNVKPTVLIGCSTVHGAFSEAIVKTMAQHVEHPIIFPLSNPTDKCEAQPKDLLEWTDGKAIIAAGSPFDPVIFKGKTIRIAQCNNAFVFPGIGLGVIAAKATRVTDAMIAAACEALSEHAPARVDHNAPVLPDFTVMGEVSRHIALAVATTARQQGVASVDDSVDFAKKIAAIVWTPDYLPYESV